MIIKKSKNRLKDYINKNRFSRLIILISSLILPILLLMNVTNIIPMEIINVMEFLWIGFYSCIFLIFFVDKKIPIWLKFVIGILNIGIILFSMFAFLMGGLQDVSVLIIKMILPFIPMNWIFNFIYSVFGEAMPYA